MEPSRDKPAMAATDVPPAKRQPPANGNGEQSPAMKVYLKQRDTEDKVAKFLGAVKTKQGHANTHEFDEKYKRDAHMHDIQVLPGGEIFCENAASVGAFLCDSGVFGKSARAEPPAQNRAGSVRGPVTCGVCKKHTDFLLDPQQDASGGEDPQEHIHIHGVCVDCAVQTIETSGKRGMWCPLCAADPLIEVLIDLGRAKHLSEAPYFVYSPEKSLLAAAYEDM